MLTIDGSSGEGGGQIIRNAVALSAISGTPVTVSGIRAGRKKPGLFPQHIAAVRAVARTCDAAVTCLEPGSRNLTFTPGKLKPCDVSISVGTAGSIPLVIMAWLPIALRTGGSLYVTGGTEVPLSPTIDYLDHVFCAVLRQSGAEIRMDIEQRGYYPAGGGAVRVHVERRDLGPILPVGPGTDPCRILSCSSILPAHVTRRQAASATNYIQRETGHACETSIDIRAGPDTGSSCTVWHGAKGGSELGRRGVPAEKVGESAALAATESFQAPGDVDIHLADQLLVPLALCGGRFTTAVMTTHAETTLWLLGQFGYTVQFRVGSEVEFSA